MEQEKIIQREINTLSNERSEVTKTLTKIKNPN